jgi:hypothetical protein
MMRTGKATLLQPDAVVDNFCERDLISPDVSVSLQVKASYFNDLLPLPLIRWGCWQEQLR